MKETKKSNAGQPRSLSPESIGRAFKLYRAEIDDINSKLSPLQKPIPFLITGFCVYAGIARDTFSSYAKTPEYTAICAEIRAYSENDILTMALRGGIKENMAKFALQNLHGWVDKQEIKQDLNIDYSGASAVDKAMLLAQAIEVLKNGN